MDLAVPLPEYHPELLSDSLTQYGDSQPRATSIFTKHKLLSETAQSSREPSAALSEFERRAKEQEQKLAEVQSRRQSLLEQLDEEARIIEEDLQNLTYQADSERQKAIMTARFEQAVAQKQEEFRSQLADEVYIRAAQSLRERNDYSFNSAKAVADGRYSEHDVEVLKACFFDALSGAGRDFVSYCAARVLELHNSDDPLIDEKTIKSVEDSRICFTLVPPADTDTEISSAIHATIEPVEKTESIEVSEPDHRMNEDVASEATNNTEVPKRDERSPKSVNETTLAHEELSESLKQPQETIKSEAAIVKEENNRDEMHQLEEQERGRRTSMKQLDEERVASQSRQTNTTEITTFTLGSNKKGSTEVSVDLEESDEESTVLPKKAVAVNVSKKRKVNEDSDDDEIESRASTPVKPRKKQKAIAKTPGTGIVALANLKKYIETKAASQQLNNKDFECSKCGKDITTVDKPRITKTCSHLYCNKCITEVRAQQKKSSKGASPDKTRCIHKGCSSVVGPMAILDNKDVRKLKLNHQDSIEESSDDDDGEDLAEKTDTEVASSDDDSDS